MGGYFSPSRFLNQMIRLEAAWPAGDRIRFNAGGGLGRQQVEDTLSRDPDSSTSSDAHVDMSFRVGARLTLRAELGRQDVASAFDRTRAGIHLLWSF